MMKSRSYGGRVTPSSSDNNDGPLKLRRFQSLRKARSNGTQATLPANSSSSAAAVEEDRSDLVFSGDFSTEVMIRQRDASTLHELALYELSRNRLPEATDCWISALESCGPCDEDQLESTILLQLLQIHLQQQEESANSPQQREYHEAEARTYLNQLHLPTLRDFGTSPSPLLLDYLVEHKEWDSAIRLAESLHVKPDLMARIWYEYGIQSSVSTSVRMDCMTKCLACPSKDNRLKLAAHGELVQLHKSAGSYLQAMQHHEERLGMLENSTDIAKAFYEEGEIYCAMGHRVKAMQSLEKGIALYPNSLILLQAKADLLYLNGKLDEAMKLHEVVLKKTTDSAQQTKILYTLGRICVKMGSYEKANQYYQKELQLTQKVFGAQHLECSRVFHELARLSDQACDFDKALEYLHKALAIETSLQKDGSQEVSALIRETNKLIGRIYYKMGDFGKALTTSFGDANM